MILTINFFGHKITLEIEYHCTILEMKRMIGKREGINDISQILLLYQGKVLQDKSLLGECVMDSLYTMQVIIRTA